MFVYPSTNFFFLYTYTYISTHPGNNIFHNCFTVASGVATTPTSCIQKVFIHHPIQLLVFGKLYSPPRKSLNICHRLLSIYICLSLLCVCLFHLCLNIEQVAAVDLYSRSAVVVHSTSWVLSKRLLARTTT